MDFFMISTRPGKKGVIEIYPRFIIPTRKKSSDLMIRGGDFYAVWMEDKGLWSTDEGDVLQTIDHELDLYLENKKDEFADYKLKVLHMWDAQTGMIDTWHKYCQKQLRDSYHTLDEKIIFSNVEPKKEDYASKRLSYPLEKGSIEAYDRLMSVLYSEDERRKIEWAIGSIVAGDSKTIQKFIVLYGEAGTGKSTVLNIIDSLFGDYCISFESKVLGQSNASFALEQFKSNPLVAIDHEGKLSGLEDNTRLNSIVSHDKMIVNEKFKSPYENRFKCFLFIGTNEPVRITNAKSGLLRRLIDVSPTGNKIPSREYKKLVKQIDFELGAIAQHCLEVYTEDPDHYENYIPTTMLSATNDFYNFVLDSYITFKKEDGVSLAVAYEMYKNYCDMARVPYPYTRRVFKEELKNYFKEYCERYQLEDGTRVRSYYKNFRVEKFEESNEIPDEPEKKEDNDWLVFREQHSLFDSLYSDCPAQYAKKDETPSVAWDDVKTTLKDLDTSKLHYILTQVKEPNLIVIDFDIKDPVTGEKSYDLNYAAASKWPKTYAELSKSGKAIHLHYIYNGDVSQLSRIYDEHIEIKVFTGKSSLRRALTLCNDIPIATISSGLPIKKGDKVVNENVIKSEQGLRKLIIRNLNKEIHSSTASSVDFIYHILEDAYESGLVYDISDMKPSIIAFAASSSNQSEKCLNLVTRMHFKSEEDAENEEASNDILVFYDIEVFPNLFVVNWKKRGKENKVIRMINPTGEQVNALTQFKLIGFNNRRYDNHILYARVMGYNNRQLYELSQKIISGDRNAFFGNAYNISFTDVYDFCSKKQSLKKWEIELGIHHQELGLPWDKPVPEELWAKVAEYCDNDVIATEAVFEARQADFIAREILADVAGSVPNDTTNGLTTKIIFGDNRHPQSQFNYRDMGNESERFDDFVYESQFDHDFDSYYTAFDFEGKPIFPGYKYEAGKSTYRGEEVGEGGYVYSEPGMYFNVALLDIASMHPSSIVAEELFGPEYTARFNDILQARIAIKHKDFDKARTMLGGKLAKYLTDESAAKDLAQALKIAINSVYGLTAALFENPFRDIRNKDNIVAKRGALFMVNLKHEVQSRGFTVAHIKTDSIKIPNATPEIIKFVTDYGKLYGYNFEHEATYDRMCLVNDAVYICKHDGEWDATGTQFAVPYVFKKLFSHEPIKFKDMCETKSVAKGELYLDMNEALPDVSDLEKELEKAVQKYKKGLLSDISYDEIKARLEPEIEEGHSYQFVGRVGSFCPIKPGLGGGVLYRKQDGKYYAAAGTKGYRWLESETVRDLENARDMIDESYYISLVDDAVDTISQYGDFEMFVSDDPIAKYMNVPESVEDEIPFA
ncbi:MAG: DUF5906 domain-containing protein [Butyrivibrio hungatei]|nr:DUF5906 domain-containing protein [Butyrivibrio hungatei]